MTKIRILDPDTVNQIAAGEVVERPASVVKELLENSIDAGATSILIDIASDMAGVTKIRVTDDCGRRGRALWSPTTSKIQDITDLSAVGRSFGEALASIVVAERLVCRPRRRPLPLGHWRRGRDGRPRQR